MKKMLCVLLALGLLCCAVAFAEGTYNQDNTTATTTLTTTIAGPQAPTYTVIIPSTLAISPNATSTPLMIELTEVQHASEVKITTAASGSMSNGSGGIIDFTVSPNEIAFTNFASLPSVQQVSVNITAAEWQQAPAGDYTGSLTFIISAK